MWLSPPTSTRVALIGAGKDGSASRSRSQAECRACSPTHRNRLRRAGAAQSGRCARRRFRGSVQTRRDTHRNEAARNKAGAATLGSDRWHRRSDTEYARLIARRRDHSARLRTADGDGPSAQRGIVTLFDRRVKRVHVDMDDLARDNVRFRYHRATSSKREHRLRANLAKARNAEAAGRQWAQDICLGARPIKPVHALVPA